MRAHFRQWVRNPLWVAVVDHKLHPKIHGGLGKTSVGFALLAQAQEMWQHPCHYLGPDMPDPFWLADLGVQIPLVKHTYHDGTDMLKQVFHAVMWDSPRLLLVDTPIGFVEPGILHQLRDLTNSRGQVVVWLGASESIQALCSAQIQVAGAQGRHLLGSLAGEPVRKILTLPHFETSWCQA